MPTHTKVFIILASLFIVCATVVALFYFGVLQFNNPSKQDYPIRGVDVASYQGKIDWSILSGEGIRFAYIKATEGSGFVDRYFDANYKNAAKTSLRIGAYHFFSFDSTAETQSDLFIMTVPKIANMLPPAVDFEYYADKASNPPVREAVNQELSMLLDRLEKHYNMRPIIYTTEDLYGKYLEGDFGEYDIWIRNVLTPPTLSDGRDWRFWQYTNRERLRGYDGVEYYIDMNAFNGSEDEFLEYGK